MTNTITLPRINSNILVVTSFILICAMMFLTVLPALAWHCGLLKLALDVAIFLANLAMDVVRWLMDIGAPQWMIDVALAASNYLNGLMNDAWQAYQDCLAQHNGGGCDTGGCDTGGCGS